jgi:hypothetical protein
MKRIISIFILSSFLSFIACKNSTENEIRNKYIAEWKSTKKPVPYSATLKINKDYTFEFNSGACMSNSHSKGKWRIENDTIILNSFKPKDCCLLIVYGGNCEKYGKIGENYMFKKSFKDCDLKTEDSYDVFENTKFYQKNDTLVFIKSKINDCEDLGKWNDNLVLGKASIK